ncbi:hypothetical protein ACSBM8_19285 [Sphingomonas sp. ASY06-1R]|uniref:hypothetical protein n=1 Tax=Sphingomonas sp. ASY06-1R TaxID=3445771 RepID=UPI003FA1D144
MANGDTPPAGEEKQGVSPSAFMRERRPEYYSDTADKSAYVLDAALLGFKLSTITERNETHDFELFCRKLCERVITPNIRPPSGPEGGGDAKVDADTYTVSEEVAERWLIGEGSNGKERYGFAFSAKAKWSEKVRADVKGIIDSGQEFDCIYFVSSQATRARDRARIEQELSQKYGVEVEILDRAWIIKEVVENDRKDIAFNYLSVGQAVSDPMQLGPTDYSRTRQLADIEKLIGDPAALSGLEGQLVSEALLAAKLSRNLERPRFETEGRLGRAVRLADKYGSHRQQLEARYEEIRTAFWWFDDVDFLTSRYDEFEALLGDDTYARNVEFLCTLHQLLVNSIIRGALTPDQADFETRSASLTAKLTLIAADEERPNNRLEARTMLAIHHMNEAILSQSADMLPAVWSEFSSILDDAEGLGEFRAYRLPEMIDLGGNLAVNDPSYGALVEKLADFVARRTSEAQGALVLLKRAKQIQEFDKLETIRLLGKAASRLTKEEHVEELIEAQIFLMMAYRSAGLLWAARATALFISATFVSRADIHNEMSPRFIPTMKALAWLSLELGVLPDALYAIQLMRGAAAGTRLPEAAQKITEKSLTDLDISLGSRLINATDEELARLTRLPDLLTALSLFGASVGLMYILGYEQELRDEGTIPAIDDGPALQQQMSVLASQPVARSLKAPLLLSEGSDERSYTVLLGMKVEIFHETGDLPIMIARTILACLEAFFATTTQLKLLPHTDLFTIYLVTGDTDADPRLDLNLMAMSANLIWPVSLSPADFRKQEEIHHAVDTIVGNLLGAAFIIQEPDELLKTLFVDEAVRQRLAMIVAANVSHHRLTDRDVKRLSDWNEHNFPEYPARLPRPKLDVLDLTIDADDAEAEDEPSGEPHMPTDHRDYEIRSVIDIHAWGEAGWRGVGMLQMRPDYPPILALVFDNEEAARTIFIRWIARFGNVDEADKIRVAIVRNVFPDRPHHYFVQIASREPPKEDMKPGKPVAMAARAHLMEPHTSENIDRFLKWYQEKSAYYLMPAVMTEGEPKWLTDCGLILKRQLFVKKAADVGPTDIENMSLRQIVGDDE